MNGLIIIPLCAFFVNFSCSNKNTPIFYITDITKNQSMRTLGLKFIITL